MNTFGLKSATPVVRFVGLNGREIELAQRTLRVHKGQLVVERRGRLCPVVGADGSVALVDTLTQVGVLPRRLAKSHADFEARRAERNAIAPACSGALLRGTEPKAPKAKAAAKPAKAAPKARKAPEPVADISALAKQLAASLGTPERMAAFVATLVGQMPAK